MPYDRRGRWYPHYGEGGEFEPYYGQPYFEPEGYAGVGHPYPEWYSEFRPPNEAGPTGESSFQREGRRRGPYTGVGPAGYRRSDERLLEDVSDALARDPWLNAAGVRVTVGDQEVTLEGTVDTPTDKRRVDNLAWGVLGVRDVHNRLRVRHSEKPGTTRVTGSTEAA